MTDREDEIRSLFPGWLGGPSELGDFIRTALLVPDANVLLGCYRIGPHAREQLLTTLERQNDRIWVPHQSVLEFSRNRRRVLPDQKKRHGVAKNQVSAALNKASSAIEDAVKILVDYRTAYIAKADWRPEQHGLTRDGIREKISDLLKPVMDELAEIQDEHDVASKDFVDESKDPILARISAILKGKMGPRYDGVRIRDIVRDTVEFRFPNSIPPGYMDAKEKDELGAAGDVILWLQMIDRLRSNEGSFKKVIWITNDVKPDLWEVNSDGTPLAARPELVQEMREEADAHLLMLNLHDFLAGAKEYLNEDISEETLEQAQGLTAAENTGLLTFRRLQERVARILDNSAPEQLGQLLSQLFANMGYAVQESEARENGVDIVLLRGGEKTIVAVRKSGYYVNTALGALNVAADAMSAQQKILVNTGTFTGEQLDRGLASGIEMIDFANLVGLLDG